MPKTGRNIYKRKDNRWEGRYIKKRADNGKIIYGSVYGKSYTEVKQQLTTLNAEKPKPTVYRKTSNKQNPTFAEIANSWLSIISLKVKPSTYSGYAATLENHILPPLRKYRIQNLTSADVSTFTKNKLESGRKDVKGGLSTKTVRDALYNKGNFRFCLQRKYYRQRFFDKLSEISAADYASSIAPRASSIRGSFNRRYEYTQAWYIALLVYGTPRWRGVCFALAGHIWGL